VEEVREFVRAVLERWGQIDVLVNNAGIIQAGPVECMTPEDFETAMQTHFWGPLRMIEAVLPGMRGRGGGRIVNIASIGGKVSVPHLLPYNSSKFALVGLSEGLRNELAREGITVTTVCPGLMRTGSPRNAFFKGRHRAEYAWFSIGSSIPGLTMSSQRAARQIIEACRRGDAEAILSMPAKVAARANALFPETTARVLSLVNRLLPRPGGINAQNARGSDSQSAWSPSLLTALSDRAAVRNNEVRETHAFR
jgi:NAD(P)-dependent dehydrogenase (short-subunit alcohol dehydrogenase family)